jgi:hypothetical protein
MKTRRIKIIFATLFAIVIVVFGLKAQDKRGIHDPEARAKKQTEMMKTELALSVDQASKVENINLKYAQKMKEQREIIHQQMKSMREDKEKEMAAVLNKDQVEKYNKLKADQRSKRMENRKGCMKKKEEKK